MIPGLAVAREMQSRGWSVSWLGTPAGLENKLVPPSGIPIDTIGFSGLRGKGAMHMLTGGFRLLGAFWSCLRIIRQRRTTAVLGMGGYVCFPGGLMASLLRRPLVLVNADASLLMSNKALLSVAGRLGARALNECVPKALALIDAAQRPMVTHQTGQANLASVQAAYADKQVAAQVLPFIDDMATQLAECDLIVCRAGAVTVSELCAAGVPAVLVPLIVSTTSHQRDNAQWLAGQGAGIHLPQAELSPRKLADLLSSLTREALLNMATKARALAKPRAAARVADQIEGLVAA